MIGPSLSSRKCAGFWQAGTQRPVLLQFDEPAQLHNAIGRQPVVRVAARALWYMKANRVLRQAGSSAGPVVTRVMRDR